MEIHIQEQIDKIAQGAIQESELIKCSLREYLYALRELADQINARADQVRQELGD